LHVHLYLRVAAVTLFVDNEVARLTVDKFKTRSAQLLQYLQQLEE